MADVVWMLSKEGKDMPFPGYTLKHDTIVYLKGNKCKTRPNCNE